MCDFLKVVADVLRHYANLGDVQTCVSLLVVLQKIPDIGIERIIGEKIASYWLVVHPPTHPRTRSHALTY